MASVTRGYSFGATEQVTNTKLHTLVDSATVSSIVNADIDAGAAISDTKVDLASIAQAVEFNGAVTGSSVHTMNSKIMKWAKGADVASANGNIALGDDGNYFDITGTNAITSITIKAAGTLVMLQFDSTATLTDGSNLSLASNFTGAAGSTITLVSDGTNWVEVSRSPSSFTPTVSNALSGSIIQTIYKESAAQVAVSATYTADDTPPLYQEGNVIISDTITPNNASNKIRITFDATGVPAGNMNVVFWLNDATGTDASLQTVGQGNLVANGHYRFHLTRTLTAGGTSAITFYIVGAVDSSTLNLASSSFWGDTGYIALTIEEIKA